MENKQTLVEKIGKLAGKIFAITSIICFNAIVIALTIRLISWILGI